MADDDDEDEEGPDETIEINCLDVAVDASGAVTSLVVTSDGESFRSYVVVHKRIDRPGEVIYETDCWCHSLWRVEDGPIYVVDNDGILHTTEPGRFEQVDLGAPMGLYRIREVAGSLVACGANGVVLRRDGSGWISLGRPIELDLHGIGGTADGTLYVVGDHGTAARIDAAGWHDLHLPTDATLLCVHAWAAAEVALAGENGVFLLGAGARFRFVDPAPSAHGLCAFGGGLAVAAAGAGVARFDGTAFHVLKDDIDAQAVAASGRYLAVAAGDSVWRFDGRRWGHRTFSF
jgi:hypothetical protein